MNHSVENIILLAKQRHVDELQRLSFSTEFVETIGLIIHQLQAERGASCLYVASTGQRFAKERAALVTENHDLEQQFKQALALHLQHHSSAEAKQLTLISWILLGFNELHGFRHQVTLLKVSSPDCITFFTRLISQLVSLIFEITDNTIDSKISKHLVALYNLVQAKEFAGQERAVGSHAFGSGIMQENHHHRLAGLIALQERHFELFTQFTTEALKQEWETLKQSTLTHDHLNFRTKLTEASINQTLETGDGHLWFNLCSQRLSEIWKIQCHLVSIMHEELACLVSEAQSDLSQAKASLTQVCKPTSTTVGNAPYSLLNPDIAMDNSYTWLTQDAVAGYPMASVIHLLQQQSMQIAEIEHELSATKKALNERKCIERAKGILMRQMKVSEEEAYKVLRTSAMEQNRKIIDVAENIIELSTQPG
ncbi:nitrate regulatory protein [Methylophilus aquaticus]|uniref:Nitrate- and nitrite sensing domain-containing protein n=1 Tax=Methylophilus aquaticus TaxID=1971610 RepID=A0ABT9JQU7_9PROT|nr:nitrate regulatory protein [Methylophilus aquaticus]MDP8566942.1 nitrate- and nitrite sensing domain-containing protein [Methylophilus aquaticus]